MSVERTIGIKPARIAVQELDKSFDGKYLCCWNSFIHCETWAYNVYSKSFSQNKKIICAETPYIGREYFDTQGQRPLDTVYVRVGWGDVSTYHPKHFNIKKQYSPLRLEGILKNQNKEMEKEWRSSGDHILFPMQVPNDSSLRGIDIWAAAQYDLIKLRQNTDRKIIITLHPDIKKGWGQTRFNQSKQHFDNFKKVADTVGATISDKPSKQLLQNCWCVVTYTSGFSFDAIIRGIPVITINNRSFAAPISSNFIEEIEDPKLGNRIDWLSNVAYCEWSVEEIKQGKCRDHLLS